MMCVVLGVRARASVAAIRSLIDSPGLMLITGVFTFGCGVAMVVAHNVWSGQPLTLAVTIVGWITLIKGLALMAIPPRTMLHFYSGVHDPLRFGLTMAAGAAFGAWMTFTAISA